jgi:hypothetical protein
MPQDFASNPELFERVNSAGRKSKIDRSSANKVSGAGSDRRS